MEQTQHRLNTVAEGGDINGLYECIREDPHILDNIDNIPFVDTPLHIAAAAGSTDFALEIMNLKPSFGMKLNPDGLSPLHLALRNRHFETVRQLISFDKELIRLKGRQSYTALHYVALRNEFDCLAEFLCACPAAIEDRTIRGETALHIAVRRSNSEASEVMLGWMRRTHRRKILNWTDNEGNTVLHIAVLTSQPQIVKSILDQNYSNRNAENFEGLTARDLAIELDESEARRVILDILTFPEFSPGALLANNNNMYSLADFLKSGDGVLEGICRWIFRVQSGLSSEDPFLSLVRLLLSVLEVVHGLIARLGRTMKSAIYKRPLILNLLYLLLVICMFPVAIDIFNIIMFEFGEDVTLENKLLLVRNEVAFHIVVLIIISLISRSSIVFLFCLTMSGRHVSTSLSSRSRVFPTPHTIHSCGALCRYSLYDEQVNGAVDNFDNLPYSALVACVFSFFVSSYWNEMVHLPSPRMKRFQMLQRLFEKLD